jgi:hypothetical protein
MMKRVWILTLTPPNVWVVHLYVSYALHATACESRSKLPLLAMTLVCLAVLAVTALFSWMAMRELHTAMRDGGAGMNEDDEPRWRGRARFLVTAAFAASLFFALVVVGQTVPTLILRTCD